MLNKKWVSLIMAFSFWIVLLTSATTIVSLLISSEKNIWMNERFNMAYYAAEWWIELARYANSVYWVGFNGQIDFTKLTWSEYRWDIQYKWSLNWRWTWSQAWYLILYNATWGIVDTLQRDKDFGFYKDSRKLFLYYDNATLWDLTNNYINSCENNPIDVAFDVPKVGSEDLWIINSNDRIIYWRADANASNSWENWTWYLLQSYVKCDADSPNTPFCYNNGSIKPSNLKTWFTRWLCYDSNLKPCQSSSWTIIDFFTNTSIMKAMWPVKPNVLFSYVYPLYDENNKQAFFDNNEFYAISYNITWIDSCEIPYLTSKAKSVWQLYWATFQIETKFQKQWWSALFNYAIMQ